MLRYVALRCAALRCAALLKLPLHILIRLSAERVHHG